MNRENNIDKIWDEYFRTRDKKYYHKLLECYYPIAQEIAENTYKDIKYNIELKYKIEHIFDIEFDSHIEQDDVITAGIFAIMDLIEAMTQKPDVKFETYCFPIIRKYIFEDICGMCSLPHGFRDMMGKNLLAAINECYLEYRPYHYIGDNWPFHCKPIKVNETAENLIEVEVHARVNHYIYAHDTLPTTAKKHQLLFMYDMRHSELRLFLKDLWDELTVNCLDENFPKAMDLADAEIDDFMIIRFKRNPYSLIIITLPKPQRACEAYMVGAAYRYKRTDDNPELEFRYFSLEKALSNEDSERTVFYELEIGNTKIRTNYGNFYKPDVHTFAKLIEEILLDNYFEN